MIEQAHFTESGSIQAVIDGQVAFIPDDMADRYRQMIEKWIESGNAITPHTVPITEARAAAKARICALGDLIGARFTTGYPQHEIASWPTKFAEARAFSAGSAETPMLADEARDLGVEIATVAGKVMTKGTLYRKAATMISTLRQNAGKAIDAATTEDEIAAILDAAEADVEARYMLLVSE